MGQVSKMKFYLIEEVHFSNGDDETYVPHHPITNSVQFVYENEPILERTRHGYWNKQHVQNDYESWYAYGKNHRMDNGEYVREIPKAVIELNTLEEFMGFYYMIDCNRFENKTFYYTPKHNEWK